MIKIQYEAYNTDYDKKFYEKTFRSLTELEDWIFGQMKRPYDRENNWCAMFFPQSSPSQIIFTPVWRGTTYYIHMIENDLGIIFSDGEYTNEQKHWNDEVKEWLAHCNTRRDAPVFNFV